jgi:putative ABC transport system permease protein
LAAARTRRTARLLPDPTFHKLHPEILDYWISAKFDDPKNKELVTDEIDGAAAAAAQGAQRVAGQLCDLQFGLDYEVVEPDYGRLFLLMFGCRARWG